MVLFVPHSLDGAVRENVKEVGSGSGDGEKGWERNLWGNKHISALLSQPKIHMYRCRSSQLPSPRAFLKTRSFPKPEPNTRCVRLVCRVDS